MTEFTPHLVGVFVDDESILARPLAPHFHGRCAMVVSEPKPRQHKGETEQEALLRAAHGVGLYCDVELDGCRAVISTNHLFTAPEGAKPGDPFWVDLDVQGETDGCASGEGYEVPFGGMCPVQGDGSIDGHPCYYRARGKGWSLEVYPPGPSPAPIDAQAIWSTGRACYRWPDAGHLRAELSRQNIERAVAEFRAWKSQQAG